MIYRLQALDSEQRVVGEQNVAFSTLDNVIILRVHVDATTADLVRLQDAARAEFPDRRSVIVVTGDVEFVRLVPEVPNG